MNVNQQASSEARREIFKSLVMREGEIKRGVVVGRMHISSATFSHEYREWLDYYDSIKYDKSTRTFKYEP